MLPYLEVTHLPSSSSFYAAVTHPLGLRYLPTGDRDASGLRSIAFGSASPLFELRQAVQRPPARSRIVFSAASPDAVADFHAAAVRACPRSAAELSLAGDLRNPDPSAESRARIADLDGNTMEVVYVPPPVYPSRYGGSTVRRTQSTDTEASRILEWNYDVASSGPSYAGPHSAMARRLGRGADEPYTTLRRSVTASSQFDLAPSPREHSKGLSAAGVAGIFGVAAVGVAAGAALTYTMVKGDRGRAPPRDFDAPAFPRRSTFPEPPYPGHRGRFVDVERTVEKVQYPGAEYPVLADRRSPPAYLACYKQAGVPRSREVEDVYDDDARSRHSSRYKPAGPTIRTRSEAPQPLSRKPLLLPEADRGSAYSGSRHGASPLPVPSIRRSATFDHDSYVSARSHRTATTIRRRPQCRPSA